MVANPRSLILLWPIPSPSRLPFVRRRFPPYYPRGPKRSPRDEGTQASRRGKLGKPQPSGFSSHFARAH